MNTIQQSRDEGILTLTLNRPDKLNALNADVLQQLSEILIQVKLTNPTKTNRKKKF